MTLEKLIELLKNIKKGTFVKMTYKSVKKPLAAHKGDLIEKVSSGVYRLGITYANMKINAEKITGPMNSGEWKRGFENYIINDLDKNGNETHKLRVYTTKHKTTSKWYLNGVETTKEWLETNGYIGKQTSKPTPLFNVFVENVLALG